MDADAKRFLDDAMRDYRDEREKLRDSLTEILLWWDTTDDRVRWGAELTEYGERVRKMFDRARQHLQPNTGGKP